MKVIESTPLSPLSLSFLFLFPEPLGTEFFLSCANRISSSQLLVAADRQLSFFPLSSFSPPKRAATLFFFFSEENAKRLFLFAPSGPPFLSPLPSSVNHRQTTPLSPRFQVYGSRRPPPPQWNVRRFLPPCPFPTLMMTEMPATPSRL